MTLPPLAVMDSVSNLPDAVLALAGVAITVVFGYLGARLKARVDTQGHESRLEWDRTAATLERQERELQVLRDVLGPLQEDLAEVRAERDELRQDLQALRGEVRDRDEVLADVAAYLPVLTAWALDHGAPPPPPSPTWRLREYLNRIQATRDTDTTHTERNET